MVGLLRRWLSDGEDTWTCQGCGAQLPADATKCDRCGYTRRSSAPRFCLPIVAVALACACAPSRPIRKDVEVLNARQARAEAEMKRIGCPGPDRCEALGHCGQTVADAASACAAGAGGDRARCQEERRHAREACGLAKVP